MFGCICTHFNLLPCKGFASKQFLIKKVHLGWTEGALSGFTKVESLRTRWYVLSKTKTCRIITKVFHFYGTCFILRFLLRTFFKTVGEPLHQLTVHPKLFLRGVIKKTLMFPEDRSYQTQYFAIIFPSSLA